MRINLVTGKFNDFTSISKALDMSKEGITLKIPSDFIRSGAKPNNSVHQRSIGPN